jgi:hypothetical protein
VDQKEVIHKFTSKTVTTLNQFIQAIVQLDRFLRERNNAQKGLYGETNLYEMLNRKDPVVSELLDKKVDLDKLRVYLEEKGLPFAFKETSTGTALFFRIKDKTLATQALQNVLKDLTRNPQGFAKKVLKKSNSMTFDEKVAYVKTQNYKGKLTHSTTIKPPVRKR